MYSILNLWNKDQPSNLYFKQVFQVIMLHVDIWEPLV